MPTNEGAAAGDPSMRLTRMGGAIFGAGTVGLGLVSLLFRNFEVFWKLPPALVPWSPAIACASGIILLTGGLAMLVPPTARLGTIVITLDVLLWLLLLGVRTVARHPGNEIAWLSFGQNLMLVTGGWTLLASFGEQNGPLARSLTRPRDLRVALVLYALALPPVGLSHFVYLKLTAPLVPNWLPFHTGFAYLTGAGHIAAGLGILFGVLPRLAATAEATMVSIFTVLVWVPAIAAGPGTREPWLEFFLSAAIAGAAWIIAGSLRDAAWGLPKRTSPPSSPRSA
jgi:uncharacterized membrane protein